jgi:hypothetical protein
MPVLVMTLDYVEEGVRDKREKRERREREERENEYESEQ